MAIIYAEKADFEATSDHATVTFESGGETIAVHLPHHIAVMFSEGVKRGAWPLHCAPDGELVSFPKAKRRASK